MSISRIPGTPVHTVAKILEGLADDCVVVHDQPIGRRGARVDHIVVGPFGVLCLTGRLQRGRVTVTHEDCIAEGRRLDIASKARRQAAAVGARLKSVSGLACAPEAVVVMIGAQLTLQAQPEGVTILTDDALPLWLRSLPQALDEVEQRALSHAVADADTWKTKSSVRRTSLFGSRSAPAAGSPDPEPRRVAVHDWALFETWVRTGEHRFYVHDPDGKCLAHYDVEAKELVLANETVRGFAEAVLGPHMDAEHDVRIDPAISKRTRR
ncbi:MAG: hypothetical protein ACRDJT_11520 [Actinomycetota bacterium]